ncbi:O-antigen ligase family protein [bacterium]|nr:O-antigen ligase family protein [candidate division CSSED10-310 bacterium]
MTRHESWVAAGFIIVAGVLFGLIRPPVPLFQSLGIFGLILAGWIAAGDRPAGAAIISRLPLFFIITAAMLDYRDIFPDRIAAVYGLTPVLAWFAGRCFRRGWPSLAGLICFVGLGSAPFTELHLEFSPWLLVLLLYSGIQSVFGDGIRFRRGEMIVFGILMVFCAVALVEIRMSVYPYATFKQGMLVILGGLVMMAALNHGHRMEQRIVLVDFLICLASVYVVFALAGGLERILNMGWARGVFFRIFVFNRHPNYVIYPILMTLPLFLLRLDRIRAPVCRFIVAGFMALAVLYLVVFSFSRESWIVLGIYFLLAMAMFTDRRSREIGLGVITASAMAVAVTALLSRGVYYRLATIVDFVRTSRFQALTVFGELFMDRPWLGYGLGTNRYIYPQAYGDLFPLSSPTRQYLIEAHNAYVDVLIGTGTIGLILFALFLSGILIQVVRSTSIHRRIMVMTAAGLSVDLVFNFRLHAQDTLIMLMVLLGLVLSTGGDAGERGAEDRRAVRIRSGMAVPVLIIISVVCFLPWLGDYHVGKAQSMLATGDWPAIIRTFRKSAFVEPLNAHPHYYLAHCGVQSGDTDMADREFTRSVGLNPNYAFYRYELALHLLSRGESRQAVNQLNIAKVLDPFDEEGRIRFLSGVLHLDFGQNDIARKDFWIAMLRNPKLAGHPFWQDHFPMFQRLISDYQTFFTRESRYGASVVEHSVQLDQIARIYETAGFPQWLFGIQRVAVSRAIEEESVVIQTAAFFIRQRELDLAESVLRDALQYHPDRASYHNLLGYVRLLEGNLTQAQVFLESAESLYDHISLDNIQGYGWLKTIYETTGQTERLGEVERRLAYLQGGVIEIQRKDLTIHAGSENMRYQVPEVDSP